MNTRPSHPLPATHPSLLRRFFGVVARPQSYRNIAYLLLGLPLGTLWFSVLVTRRIRVGQLLVVALLGIPMLIGMWYAVRAFANVERAVASAFLDEHVDQAPMAAGVGGNSGCGFKAMSRDRARWRELGYLMLRFPAGIATFTLAVTALTVPVDRRLHADLRPFRRRVGRASATGSGAASCTTSPQQSVVMGIDPRRARLLLFAAFHALNAVARGCGRWTAVRGWVAGDVRSVGRQEPVRVEDLLTLLAEDEVDERSPWASDDEQRVDRVVLVVHDHLGVGVAEPRAVAGQGI